MAKVTLASDVTGIQGKLCSREGVIYAKNKRTGKIYRVHRHEYEDANTAKQQAVRTDFKDKAKFASKWWAANKPATKDAEGTENYRLVIKAYKSQTKIGNPYSYLRSLVTDDLKVKLGDLDLTGTLPSGTQGSGTTTTEPDPSQPMS